MRTRERQRYAVGESPAALQLYHRPSASGHPWVHTYPPELAVSAGPGGGVCMCVGVCVAIV